MVENKVERETNVVIDYGETYLPKVGDELTISIKAIDKVYLDPEKDTGKFPKNFFANKENKGYHYEFHLQDGGSVLVNTWGLFRALRSKNVQAGDTINLKHQGPGQWEISKVEKKEEPKTLTMEEAKAQGIEEVKDW